MTFERLTEDADNYILYVLIKHIIFTLPCILLGLLRQGGKRKLVRF
jgi:hypothetical protein